MPEQVSPNIVRKLAQWKDSPLLFVKDAIRAIPSDQQAEALAIFPKTNRLTIRSGHGCHAKGTIVLMYPYGCKLVEDVEVGDTLMGDDSTPRKVLKLYSDRERMYRVKYHDGTYYDVNESHKLALVCTGKKSEFKTGDKIEISVRDYLKLVNDRPSLKGRFAGYKVAIDYQELPVVIPPYILGLWLGDGSKNNLEITNIDKTVIGIWQAFGEANGLRMSTCNEKLHRLVGDTDNIVYNAFAHYGLWGNKHIPKEYIFNSKEVRLKLLAGLIDTDGYADSRNGLQFQIIQKNKDIAEDILFIAQSCGIHATLKEKIKSWTWNGEKKFDLYYEVGMYRNVEQIPTQIKRKTVQSEYIKQRSNLHFGFTIEKLSEDTYYGFELDKNHLYVLGDFTVTRNTGKDAFASWIILWFMTTRPYAKVACTAPTARQLSDILVSELSKWLRKSVLGEEFVVQKDKVFHKAAPKEWWVRFISPSVKATKEEQAETLAGLHGDHLLIVADEASGIPDPTFIPLEGALTQEDNKVLLIGNMTRGSGYFYDTHFHVEIKKDWERLHWDSRKSSNVKPSYPEYMARKYGVNSNVFRIRVEGEPPLADDTVLIPLYWAEQCIGKEIEVAEDEPIFLGVDVARYGDDSSVILPRQGLLIHPWEDFQGMSTMDLGGHIIRVYNDMEADGDAIDVIGVGAGVYDWLEKQGLPRTFAVNVASSSTDITKYDRLRDELWVRVRDKCQYGLYSFPDIKKPDSVLSMGQELANELSTVKYSFNKHGGFKVESKHDLKARGIASPNIADALCLTEYFSGVATKVFPKKKNKRTGIAFNPSNPVSQKYRWMYA